MLLSVKYDLISKKRGCKQNLVWPGGSNGSKVIFVILAEVVAFYVRPIAIDVQGLGLEFVSGWFIFWGVEECLDDSVQVLLAILINTRVMGSRSWSLRGSNRSLRGSRFIWLQGVFVVFILRPDKWWTSGSLRGLLAFACKATFFLNWSHLAKKLADPLNIEI